MKIIDLMTDLETLGKYNSPVITQISAVPFNIETGEVFNDHFNEFCSPMSCVKYGLEIDADTFTWWLKQDKDTIENVLIKSILSGNDIKAVLQNFNDFINKIKAKHNATEIRIYGNGVLSDIKWLESAYLAVDLSPAWSYREPSCVRSLIDNGKRFFHIDPKQDIPFTGVEHNAIDDCLHQIKYVCAIAKKMQDSFSALKKIEDLKHESE